MNGNSLWTRPTIDSMEETDGVLITQDSGAFASPESVKAFLKSSADPEMLGVPVPTAADAGKLLSVNSVGDGFTLSLLQKPVLVWENPATTESFAAQTIACDLSQYNMIAIYFHGDIQNDRVQKMSFIPKTGDEYKLTHVQVSNPAFRLSWRGVSVFDNGITLNAGGRTSIYYDSAGKPIPPVAGSACVPLKIYGLQ